jgi:hypothetical protein
VQFLIKLLHFYISRYAFLLKALHVVVDGFIEYRVIELIVNGIFEIKGVPKAMRFYEVKFHSPRMLTSKN